MGSSPLVVLLTMARGVRAVEEAQAFLKPMLRTASTLCAEGSHIALAMVFIQQPESAGVAEFRKPPGDDVQQQTRGCDVPDGRHHGRRRTQFALHSVHMFTLCLVDRVYDNQRVLAGLEACHVSA
jgi:hypothetical protein